MAAPTLPDPTDWINIREIVLDALGEYGCGICYSPITDQADAVANALFEQFFQLQPPSPIEVEEFRAANG